MPDIHGSKVRLAGVWVTHALDDREPAVVEELLSGLHLRMKTDVVVEFVKLSRIQPMRKPTFHMVKSKNMLTVSPCLR